MSEPDSGADVDLIGAVLQRLRELPDEVLRDVEPAVVFAPPAPPAAEEAS